MEGRKGLSTTELSARAQATAPGQQDRSRHIVAAAAAVMSRQGYGNTSVKDIAHEAGVAQGLIHYYFGSKEDLLLAVVHELNQELMHGVSAAMAEAGDNPLAQVVASIESIRRMFSERPEFYRLFFDLATLSFNNEALRPEVAKLYRELTDATNEMLGRVCAGMPTPLPIPQQDFAAVILAALDGVMLRTLVDQAYDPEALYRALAFMLISSASCSYYIAGEAPPLVEQIASYFLPAAGSTAGSEKKSEAG